MTRDGRTRKNNGRNGHATTVERAPRTRTSNRPAPVDERLPVLKTYKIYVGGKFPRTESGRYYILKDSAGRPIANVCDCSRKDFRDAVVCARTAQSSWASRSAYNRGQVLYRIAEMLEARSAQFVEELRQQGSTAPQARAEVAASVDRFLYYAGWADKVQQVFSSVNPVSSSHFNFSVLEPTGVVAALAPQDTGLIGLVSTIAPIITGGNTIIVLASMDKPLSAVTLAEVLVTSDLPAGVVNLLTGRRAELLEQFANHMDVNATVYCGTNAKELATIRTKAALNVKRVVAYDRQDWMSQDAQSPYFVLDTQEVKTTWHPVGT
ncbi:MAG: aldehyde dehydrogenase family protein [Tepidisphaeraceae bacterium]